MRISDWSSDVCSSDLVRYTARGGILLGVRRAGDALRIEVHDTGPGIEPVQQAAIFEEFRRGDGAGGPGLGLGLAIADRIAQLLQEPLTLRSRTGRGAVLALAVTRAVTHATELGGETGGGRECLIVGDRGDGEI